MIPTLGLGGAERWLVTLSKALQARGHEVHVAALWPPYTLASELEAEGIRVFRLDGLHRRLFPLVLWRLARVIRREPCDIVNGHLLFGSLYARFAARLVGGRPRRISTMYNLGYDSYPANNLWRKLGKALDGWSARLLDEMVLCVSTAVEAHYRSHLGLTRTCVLPLGVSAEVIERRNHTPVTSREAFGFNGGFLIVHPARFVPEKGHRYLVESLRLLKSSHGARPIVAAVGEGPLRASVQETARKDLGDQVVFMPPMAHSQLLDFLSTADMLVLPSTHDGCPTVVIEAMAVGVPVVASAVGGMLDQIESGTSGLLVPAADPAALAEAIWRVMQDQPLRERLIEGGKARVRSFSAAELAGRYEGLCMELLDGGAPA